MLINDILNILNQKEESIAVVLDEVWWYFWRYDGRMDSS